MRTIAIVSPKGGCGKTTTTVNLAGSLVAAGARVLVVDVDPKAHATLSLGIDSEALDEHLYEALAEPNGGEGFQKAIIVCGDHLDLAPSGRALAALESRTDKSGIERRSHALATVLGGVNDRYDYVLVDCPPNVGLLTFNAMRAADEIIVPVEPSLFAIQEVGKLADTIEMFSERVEHPLTLRIVTTLYDGRTRFARRMLGRIRELYAEECFDTVIRLNVTLREAAEAGVTVDQYESSAAGAVDHAALAIEVAASSAPVVRSAITYPEPTSIRRVSWPLPSAP